jgi:hypothetical protein
MITPEYTKRNAWAVALWKLSESRLGKDPEIQALTRLLATRKSQDSVKLEAALDRSPRTFLGCQVQTNDLHPRADSANRRVAIRIKALELCLYREAPLLIARPIKNESRRRTVQKRIAQAPQQVRLRVALAGHMLDMT